jgi:hypothetical protein
MARKLIVLYDGTWNTPEDQTKSACLAQRLAARDADSNEQLPFCTKGVGTHVLERRGPDPNPARQACDLYRDSNIHPDNLEANASAPTSRTRRACASSAVA